MTSSIHPNSPEHRESSPHIIPDFPSLTSEEVYQIALIDADVRGVDDAVLVLLNQRAALNRKRNEFMPMARLPAEILAIIFEFACASSGYSDYGSRLDWRYGKYWETNDNYEGPKPNASAVTPLFIGKVCSAWRTISQDASILWKSVKIQINDEHADAQAALLHYWLSKSGQHPLTVRLVEDNVEDIEVSSTAVLDVIEVYAHRIHAVELFLPCIWEPALIRIAHCLPLLTRLTLRAGLRIEYIKTVNLFNDAPLLSDVTLLGYPFAEVSLPWAQVEHLDVESTLDFDCRKSLRLCPRLRHCTFVLNYSDDLPTSIRISPITHTALEVLELSVFHETQLWGLLWMLALPSLRSFALSLRFWHSFDGMLSFLTHTTRTLEILQLPCIMPFQDLISYLQISPRLRKLMLQGSQKYNRKLTQEALDLLNPIKYRRIVREAMGLTEDQDIEDLAPNLEAFYYEGDIDVTSHALVEFFVSRWRLPSLAREDPHIGGPGTRMAIDLPAPAVRLRSVTLKTPERIEFEDADAVVVQELRQEGMHLEFL